MSKRFINRNCLLNWPKLLGLYADGFSCIFVHECVRCIIPRMFPVKKVHIFFKIMCFRTLLISFTDKSSTMNCIINMAHVQFVH